MAKKYSTQTRFALNAICPYYAMFPLEFPMGILKRTPKPKVVLDPFCGRGTTNYAAQVRGMRSFGIDSSPVAVAIAQAKFARAEVQSVIDLAAEILQETVPTEIPEGQFWNWAFESATLWNVCALREGLIGRPTTDEVAILRALCLGCLHGPRNKSRETLAYFSNQMPRTFASKPKSAIRYWKNHHLRPIEVDVLAVLKRKATRALLHPTRALNSLKDIRLGDSSTSRGFIHIDQDIDLVVTSPPYYGLQTYVEDQWLRNWFLGGPVVVPYGRSTGLGQGSPEEFSYNLGKVWYQVANIAAQDVKLVIRFGAIPSRAVDPQAIIRASLRMSGAEWKVYRTKPSESAAAGRRQADVMGTKTAPLVEYDFFCCRD